MSKPTAKKPHPDHATRAVLKADLRKWAHDLDGWIKAGLPKRPDLSLTEATRRRALLRATLKAL